MKRIGILFLVIIGLALSASAQKLWLMKGDRAFVTTNYSQALEYYAKGNLSSSDDLRTLSYIKQGHCYVQMHQAIRAVECFTKVYNKRYLFALVDYTEYGKALMELGRYEQAIKVLANAPHYPPGDIKYWIEACKRSLNKTKVDSSISLKLTNLNIVNHSYGISLNPKGILYSKQIAKDSKPAYQAFFAESYDSINFVKDSVWDIGFALPQNFNSSCLNANQSVLYYSGNLSNHEKYSKRNRAKRYIGKNGVNNLYIWQVSLNEQVRLPVELAFNNPDYSCTHPFITENDERLYFVSNMPGGYGGFDLYYVENRGDEWSQPVNLGAEINTKFDELFPFVTDEVLYFTSQGHYGYGGLDIFKAELKDKTEVVNLGYPINSSYDDFSYTLKSGDSGYFVSNRLQEDSKDRLWFFRKNAPVIESVPLNEPLEVISTLDIVALGSNKETPESILGTVYYKFDASNLTAEFVDIMDSIINFLSDNPNQLIEIRAYTDSRGSEKYNLTLSEKRAQSVYDFFEQKGISSKRMLSKAYGETQLDKSRADSSFTKEEHRKNRKVELKILSSEHD